MAHFAGNVCSAIKAICRAANERIDAGNARAPPGGAKEHLLTCCVRIRRVQHFVEALFGSFVHGEALFLFG